MAAPGPAVGVDRARVAGCPGGVPARRRNRALRRRSQAGWEGRARSAWRDDGRAAFLGEVRGRRRGNDESERLDSKLKRAREIY